MKKIMILICHYDNPEGLKASLMSIKEDFPVDVLVVDDGSVVPPDLKELKSIYKNGDIFIKYLPKNQGVGIATNLGLKKIIDWGYELTGRLDCGDRVYPNKYAIQIDYLKNNPQIKALGTWVNMVDMSGKSLFILKHPCQYSDIKNKIYLNSTFVNSSTIFYTEILQTVGLFPEKYHRNGEDYAFFFNVVEKYKCENLPKVLLDYEINPNSLSSKGRKQQVKARIKIIKEHFYWGWYPIYGILRNSVLMFISREQTTFLKDMLKK